MLLQCADIRFNSSAELLSDDQCQNSTGVGGVAIQNVDANSSESPTPSGSAAPEGSSGAASVMTPTIGTGLLAALLAWGLL